MTANNPVVVTHSGAFQRVTRFRVGLSGSLGDTLTPCPVNEERARSQKLSVCWTAGSGSEDSLRGRNKQHGSQNRFVQFQRTSFRENEYVHSKCDSFLEMQPMAAHGAQSLTQFPFLSQTSETRGPRGVRVTQPLDS